MHAGRYQLTVRKERTSIFSTGTVCVVCKIVFVLFCITRGCYIILHISDRDNTNTVLHISDRDNMNTVLHISDRDNVNTVLHISDRDNMNTVLHISDRDNMNTVLHISVGII